MNLHFGGLVGYSDSKRKGQPRRRCDGWDGEGGGGWVPSGNCISSLNSPPSQIVLSLPGMAQSQRLRSSAPCAVFTGRATKPKGWSLRQFLLRGARQTLRAVQMAGELGGTETYRSSVRRVWQSDMLASVAAGAQPCRARRPTGRGWTRWGLSASRFSVVGRGGDGETRPCILECRGRVKAQSEGSSQTSRGTIHLARNKHRDVGGLRLQLRHLIGRHVGRGSACLLARLFGQGLTVADASCYRLETPNTSTLYRPALPRISDTQPCPSPSQETDRREIASKGGPSLESHRWQRKLAKKRSAWRRIPTKMTWTTWTVCLWRPLSPLHSEVPF